MFSPQVGFRLVVTLPRHIHQLKTARFYIVVRSRGGGPHNGTRGQIYFRQDQPHIDLFVFFSVFFSCFFLFLAICIMLWKMKQTLDARQSRQMREREMECMASRPFARILVLVEHDDPTKANLAHPPVRPRLRMARYHGRSHYYNNELNSLLQLPRECGVVPVAMEPTVDGQAAVATLVLQLPGGQGAPARLCLGSVLTTKVSMPTPGLKAVSVRRRVGATSC